MENIKTMSELADIINACDNYPNAIVDAAIKTKIKTLEDLADFINSCDDYPNEIVDAAIKANGWKDEQEKTYGICSSATEVLEFNERAEAVVRKINSLN